MQSDEEALLFDVVLGVAITFLFCFYIETQRRSATTLGMIVHIQYVCCLTAIFPPINPFVQLVPQKQCLVLSLILGTDNCRPERTSRF